MNLRKAALYIIHWPGFWTEAWLDGLADVQLKGLTEAVGVSNFNAKRVRESAAQLRRRGVALSSNQIQYSLVYRTAETNGMLEACLENGVTPVAYSPLAQGLLTGKYRVGKPKPDGPRAFTFTDDKLRRAEPLLALMDEIGKGRGVRCRRRAGCCYQSWAATARLPSCNHLADSRPGLPLSNLQGKTLAQVAINWTVCKGAVPIPGVKNIRQAQEVAGAVGWRLTPEEVTALDKASKGLMLSYEPPFEKW